MSELEEKLKQAQQQQQEKSKQDRPISAVQRIINNRIASAENAEVTTVDQPTMSGVGEESVAAYDSIDTPQAFKSNVMQYCYDNGVVEQGSDNANALSNSLDRITRNLSTITGGNYDNVNWKETYNSITTSDKGVEKEVGSLELVTGVWSKIATDDYVKQTQSEIREQGAARVSDLTNIMNDDEVVKEQSEGVSGGSDSAEMLDSQNASADSEHEAGSSSLSTYEQAKEKFLNEKILPYTEGSKSDSMYLETANALDCMKSRLDEQVDKDTSNSESWSNYFDKLSEHPNPVNAMYAIEQDSINMGLAGQIGGLSNLMQNIQQIPQNAVNAAQQGLEGASNTIQNQTIGEIAVNGFGNAGKNIIDSVGKVATFGQVNSITDEVYNLGSNVMNSTIPEIGQGIGDTINSGVEGVQKTIGDLANNAKDGVSNVINMGQNGLSNMGATIGDIANNAGKTIGDMAGNIGNMLNNKANSDKPKAVETEGASYSSDDSQEDEGNYSLLESKMMNSRYC